jgi:hypothetical protein
MVGQWWDYSVNFIVRLHRLHHHLVGQWWDNGGTNGKTRRKCFLVSKCDTVVSVGLASNCTSLRVCVATVGEMSVESVGVSSANSGQGRDWRRMRMRMMMTR